MHREIDDANACATERPCREGGSVHRAWSCGKQAVSTTIAENERGNTEIRQTIGQNPNTRLISFDWNEPMKSLRVQVDQDRVRQLGVSSKTLSEALNAVTSGMVVTEVRDSI